MSETVLEGKPPLPLESVERRIIGALIEKAMTTPDLYPLTANALVAACNQKNNRDPVMSLESDTIDEALLSLKAKGLVLCVLPATGRTERWKHLTKEYFGVSRVERAVLAELLLRGAQTEGELRGRASRMAPIETLEELRAVLEGLAQRGFVQRISQDGRQRGAIWTHLLCSPRELAEAQARASSETPASTRAPARSGDDDRWTRIEASLTSLRAEIDELRQQLNRLTPGQTDTR